MQETQLKQRLFDSSRNSRSQEITLQMDQHEELGTDILALTWNQPLSKKSNLLSLTPFLDEKSIMRSRGRLSKVDIHSSAKETSCIATAYLAIS